MQLGKAVEYISLTKRIKVERKAVEGLWEVFKVKEFTGAKYYADAGAIFTHFINSLRFEKIEAAPPAKSNDKRANDILKLTD